MVGLYDDKKALFQTVHVTQRDFNGFMYVQIVCALITCFLAITTSILNLFPLQLLSYVQFMLPPDT